MFSTPKTKGRLTIATRLTLWYAAIFTLSSVIAFALFYIIMATVIAQRSSDDLVEDIKELSALLTDEGLDALERQIMTEVASDGADAVFFRLTDAGGHELIVTDISGWKGLPTVDRIARKLKNGDSPIVELLKLPGRAYGVRTAYGRLPDGGMLQIAESTEEDDEFLEILRNTFALTTPLFIVIAGLFGWFMARKALAGVHAIANTAREISEGALQRRVPETGSGDEIDTLAVTFNMMLDRIQALIGGMREMTDNIAHDLRSPLTRIRGSAESVLTGKQTLDEYQALAGDTIEECDRLIHMINTMLYITETESGVANNVMDNVDIGAIIRDACELFQPLAEDKNITLALAGNSDATVHGNIHSLQRMVANLLDNALKYTPRGGSVSLGLTRQNHAIEITVRDTGRGIAPEDVPNVFKRFYRGDQSRSQAGSGLGLSLARAIARAHGGDITVASAVNEGSRFTVTLPIGSG